MFIFYIYISTFHILQIFIDRYLKYRALKTQQMMRLCDIAKIYPIERPTTEA